jgi:MtN3 and saliva related transmembrane protein
MLHGILVKDPALIAANSISFVLAFLLLGFKLKNDYSDFIIQFCRKSGKS